MTEQLTFLLVDDHTLILDALSRIINQKYKDATLEKVHNRSELFSVKIRPNVIFLDLNLEGTNMINHLDQVKKYFNTSKIIILTSFNSPSIIKEVMEHNIDGFLSKDTKKEEIYYAINQVLEGYKYINQYDDLRFDLNKMEHGFEKIMKLSSREKEVLRLVASGITNSAISESLSISTHTVQSHRKNLFKKLDVHSVNEVMAIAYRYGLT